MLKTLTKLMKETMKKEGKRHLHVVTQHLDKGLKSNLPLVIHASKLAKQTTSSTCNFY